MFSKIRDNSFKGMPIFCNDKKIPQPIVFITDIHLSIKCKQVYSRFM